MTAKELRDQSDEELQALLLDQKRERFEALCVSRTSRDKYRSHEVKNQRITIARIKTVLRERQLSR